MSHKSWVEAAFLSNVITWGMLSSGGKAAGCVIGTSAGVVWSNANCLDCGCWGLTRLGWCWTWGVWGRTWGVWGRTWGVWGTAVEGCGMVWAVEGCWMLPRAEGWLNPGFLPTTIVCWVFRASASSNFCWTANRSSCIFGIQSMELSYEYTHLNRSA